MKFSLPYIDQPVSFWNTLYRDFGEWIQEIYFPIGDHVVPSGRPVQTMHHLFAFLEKTDLPKTVLINPIVLPEPLERIEDVILNELILLDQRYGVKSATVSDLLLCKSIKKALSTFEVNGSVLMRINSSEQIPYLQRYTDSISLDTAIIRDLKRIRAIRKSYLGKIKLIVNEGCLPGCPFRVQHFYEMNSNLAHPESLCETLLHDVPWLRIKSSWILPQHLHFYEGLYDIIKLAGRVTLQNPEKYMNVFQAYLEQKPIPVNEIGCGPGGMIINIHISDEFFYQTITCDKNCSRCDVCKAYFDSHV